MFKLIKNIFFMWLFLRIGAFLGSEKVAIGEDYIIGKAQACCTWVSDKWNGEEEQEEDKDKEE